LQFFFSFIHSASYWLLPLLRKLSRSFLNNLSKLYGCGVTSTDYSLSPNLFNSTGLLCPTYLIQVERSVEVDQAVSCKPLFKSLRRNTDLLPPQPLISTVSYAAKGKISALSSNILPSLISANITFISFITTAHSPSLFFRS